MFNRKIKHFKTEIKGSRFFTFFFQQIKNSGYTILCNFVTFSQQIRKRGARFRQTRRVKERHAFLGLFEKLALKGYVLFQNTDVKMIDCKFNWNTCKFEYSQVQAFRYSTARPKN